MEVETLQQEMVKIKIIKKILLLEIFYLDYCNKLKFHKQMNNKIL